jgi:hypothetical protein
MGESRPYKSLAFHPIAILNEVQYGPIDTLSSDPDAEFMRLLDALYPDEADAPPLAVHPKEIVTAIFDFVVSDYVTNDSWVNLLSTPFFAHLAEEMQSEKSDFSAAFILTSLTAAFESAMRSATTGICLT